MTKKDTKIAELTEEVAVLSAQLKIFADTMKTIRGEHAKMKLWMVKTRPYGLIDTSIYDLFKERTK